MEMATRKSLLSFLSDGYQQYQFYQKTKRVISTAEDRLRKIQQTGDVLPSDLEQVLSTEPGKQIKPIGIKLRKLFDIVSRSLSNDNVYRSTYDFERIANIYQKEPYMMRAVNYYIESVLREGSKIVGTDPSFVDYILVRLKQMEIVSEQDIRQVYRQMLLSLLLFGNVIISKRRNTDACSGNAYTRFDGKNFEPVAGYFVEDPRTIVIEKSETGKLIYRRTSQQAVAKLSYSYREFGNRMVIPFGAAVLEKDRVFQKEDIIHIKYHPLPGDMWGCPPFLGALDDMVTLRAIEECAELQVYQYGHPLIHVGVGTDKLPGKDEEIIAIQNEVESMEGNGMLVTSHRVKMENVTGKGAGLDLTKYLEYFKKRVFSGLNVDGNIMGEGETANKESSNVIDKSHGGFVVELQTHMKMGHDAMITDYKYEFGLNIRQFFEPRYEVHAEYPEVDLNSKIALENHYINAFAQNAITRSELRKEMGRNAMSEEEQSDTFNELITLKNTEVEAEMTMKQTQLMNQGAIQIAHISSSARAASAAKKPVSSSASTTAKSRTSGSSNQTKNKTAPANQHGKKITVTPKKG